MKSLTLLEIGQSVSFTEVANPLLEENSSIVKLSASALNHRDVWITKGMYPGIKTPIILGSDGAGTVEGKDVIINPGINWGENQAVQSDQFEVLGLPRNGTFAEEICIENKYIFPKPEHLSIHEAAALPLAGLTAYRVLFERCQVQPSDKVLITGAGGGVALMAIQFALALGCEVHVTSGSNKKIEKAIDLGAKKGYNYKEEEWYKRADGPFDVIIDSAGGDSFQYLVRLCAPGARIGFYGATLGKYTNLNPQILFWRQVSILGSTMGSDLDFKAMLEFVAHHKIRPIIDEVFPLEDGAKAFAKMEAGMQFGKIVLKH
ncbi:MAG: zinc-binding dehydrogenase [Bacteroidota bacterium]